MNVRRSSTVPLALPPRHDGQSLHQWLYDALRLSMAQGLLPADARLPASRELAREHDISRATVTAVFDRLLTEGYVVARVGQGTFVAPRPQVTAAVSSNGHPGHALSQRGEALTAVSPFPLAPELHLRAFRAHVPDVEHFPFDVWGRLLARLSRDEGAALACHIDPKGYLPLREAIAAHLRHSRGLACDPGQIVMLGSAQQGLDLLSRLLTDPGDPVWIESPGYPGAAAVLRAAGAQLIALPIDAEGLRVDEGERLAPAARLVYTTSARHAPLGMTMSAARRRQLLRWAERAQALVIEDDYDSEFRFVGPPSPALKSLPGGERVALLGSFSKTMYPSLRIAYAVMPDALVDPITRALSLTHRTLPTLPQAALHRFIEDGHYGRHLRHMRGIYEERARTLERCVDAAFGHWLSIPAIEVGLDTPAFLPPQIDDQALCAVAHSAGVLLRPLSAYGLRPQDRSGVVMGFAAHSVADIREGVRLLEQAVDGARRRKVDLARQEGGAPP